MNVSVKYQRGGIKFDIAKDVPPWGFIPVGNILVFSLFYKVIEKLSF
jgi:hypothetical protein